MNSKASSTPASERYCKTLRQVSGLPMQAPPALTISDTGTDCAPYTVSFQNFMNHSYERGGLPSIQGANRLRTASLYVLKFGPWIAIASSSVSQHSVKVSNANLLLTKEPIGLQFLIRSL